MTASIPDLARPYPPSNSTIMKRIHLSQSASSHSLSWLLLVIAASLCSCATTPNDRDLSALDHLSDRWNRVSDTPPTYVPAQVDEWLALTVANSERIAARENSARWIIPNHGLETPERQSLKHEAIETALNLRTRKEAYDAELESFAHVAGSILVAPAAVSLISLDRYIKWRWEHAPTTRAYPSDYIPRGDMPWGYTSQDYLPLNQLFWN
jgi:hypothetical protein